MTHTIPQLTVEFADNFHDYVTVELEDVTIDVELDTNEVHGTNITTESSELEYTIMTATNSFGEDVVIKSDIKKAMEAAIFDKAFAAI